MATESIDQISTDLKEREPTMIVISMDSNILYHLSLGDKTDLDPYLVGLGLEAIITFLKEVTKKSHINEIIIDNLEIFLYRENRICIYFIYPRIDAIQRSKMRSIVTSLVTSDNWFDLKKLNFKIPMTLTQSLTKYFTKELSFILE